MQKATIRLSTGLELTFADLSIWDMSEYQSKFGEALGRAQAEQDADPKAAAVPNGETTKATLFLVFRAAVAGGFEGTFEEFGRKIPMNEYAKVTEAAMPFLGKDEDSE